MEYYINVNNEKRGPYAPQELAQRGLTAETLVMAAEDGAAWIPAWQVEELRPLLMQQSRQEAPSGGAETPSTAVPATQEAPREQPAGDEPTATAQPAGPADKPRERKSHGCLWTLLVLVLLGALMVYSCPNKQKHSEKLATVISDGVSEAVEKTNSTAANDIVGKAFDMVGGNLRKMVIETLADQFLEVDDHKLCSVGKIHYDGEDHIVSVGLLGYVFTVDKAKIKQLAETYYVDKEQEFKQSVQEQFNDNVVNPAKDKLKEMIGSVLGSFLNGLGISPDAIREEMEKMEDIVADSI